MDSFWIWPFMAMVLGFIGVVIGAVIQSMHVKHKKLGQIIAGWSMVWVLICFISILGWAFWAMVERVTVG